MFYSGCYVLLRALCFIKGVLFFVKGDMLSLTRETTNYDSWYNEALRYFCD